MNYQADQTNTSDKLSNVLCDIESSSKNNIPDYADYVENTQLDGERGRINTAVGMATTGAFIYNPINDEDADRLQDETSSLDMCISHSTSEGQFHYLAWSPCIKGSGNQSVSPGACDDND